MKHVCDPRKNGHTKKENTSRGWPRVLSRRNRITKLVCPRSLMSQIHECHEVAKTGYLPLLTSLHSKRSFSEYVSNCTLSEDSKKEWALLFHPFLENFMSQNTFHWFTVFSESSSYIPHMINLNHWLIGALLANSLSSCVRKVAEARSAGSTLAATIAIRTVAIPSRIWQCQLAFFVFEEGTDKNPSPTWETAHTFHLDYCWSEKTWGNGIREPISVVQDVRLLTTKGSGQWGLL